MSLKERVEKLEDDFYRLELIQFEHENPRTIEIGDTVEVEDNKSTLNKKYTGNVVQWKILRSRINQRYFSREYTIRMSILGEDVHITVDQGRLKKLY